jgi:GNAT superfamily N-acetyltransferase
MRTGFTIRAAAIDDAPRVAALMASLGYETTPEEMRVRLNAISAHSDYASLVALHDNNIVGFLGLTFGLFYERNGTYARIVALAVAAENQRTGVGRALIDAAEALAVRRGAIACLVSSGLRRLGAHLFYERLGFAHKGKSYSRSLDHEDVAQQDVPADQPRPAGSAGG